MNTENDLYLMTKDEMWQDFSSLEHTESHWSEALDDYSPTLHWDEMSNVCSSEVKRQDPIHEWTNEQSDTERFIVLHIVEHDRTASSHWTIYRDVLLIE